MALQCVPKRLRIGVQHRDGRAHELERVGREGRAEDEDESRDEDLPHGRGLVSMSAINACVCEALPDLVAPRGHDRERGTCPRDHLIGGRGQQGPTTLQTTNYK